MASHRDCDRPHKIFHTHLNQRNVLHHLKINRAVRKIERSALARNRSCKGADFILIQRIHNASFRASAGAHDLIPHRFESGKMPSGQKDVSAMAGQSLGDGAAQGSARPINNRVLVMQHHQVVFYFDPKQFDYSEAWTCQTTNLRSAI